MQIVLATVVTIRMGIHSWGMPQLENSGKLISAMASSNVSEALYGAG
jgi:hypothetical protein